MDNKILYSYGMENIFKLSCLFKLHTVLNKMIESITLNKIST